MARHCMRLQQLSVATCEILSVVLRQHGPFSMGSICKDGNEHSEKSKHLSNSDKEPNKNTSATY